MTTEVDLATLTRRVLSEQSAAYGKAGETLPQNVHDAVSDYKAAIGDQLAAGDQLARDTVELRGKRDLIPAAGYWRLKQDAQTEAQTTVNAADRRAADALGRLRTALTDAAQPQLEPEREGLARQELALAIGEAKGSEAAARALQVAESGSRESAAALLSSSFGETLLQARGLTGHELGDAMEGARAVAAQVAPTRGATPREVLAARLIDHVDGLGAARGAAGSYLSQVMDAASR